MERVPIVNRERDNQACIIVSLNEQTQRQRITEVPCYIFEVYSIENRPCIILFHTTAGRSSSSSLGLFIDEGWPLSGTFSISLCLLHLLS